MVFPRCLQYHTAKAEAASVEAPHPTLMQKGHFHGYHTGNTHNTLGRHPRTDWVAVARQLGPTFAARAAAHDANDAFVADNYAELKQHKIFSAGVPAELGGGASHAALCAMLRELAHACGSTALALSMHTHLLASYGVALAPGSACGTPAQTYRR